MGIGESFHHLILIYLGLAEVYRRSERIPPVTGVAVLMRIGLVNPLGTLRRESSPLHLDHLQVLEFKNQS
jgi:hypothetical protein